VLFMVAARPPGVVDRGLQGLATGAAHERGQRGAARPAPKARPRRVGRTTATPAAGGTSPGGARLVSARSSSGLCPASCPTSSSSSSRSPLPARLDAGKADRETRPLRLTARPTQAASCRPLSWHAGRVSSGRAAASLLAGPQTRSHLFKLEQRDRSGSGIVAARQVTPSRCQMLDRDEEHPGSERRRPIALAAGMALIVFAAAATSSAAYRAG